MRQVNELKEKVARLERELAQANKHIQFLSSITGQEVQPNGQNATSQQKPEAAGGSSMFDDSQRKVKKKPTVTKVS